MCGLGRDVRAGEGGRHFTHSFANFTFDNLGITVFDLITALCA